MHTTLRTAAHVAHLDPLTGEGLLVLPHPEHDVRDPFNSKGPGSVHGVDWHAMVSALDA